MALVVIGPERLPRVARTMGVLFGRLQRYVTQVKSDINREMDLAEVNRVKTEFEDAARSFKQDVESTASKTEQELRDSQSSIERDVKSSATDSVMEPATPPADSPATVFPRGLLEEPPATFPTDVPVETPGAASPQMELGIDEPAPVRARNAV